MVGDIEDRSRIDLDLVVFCVVFVVTDGISRVGTAVNVEKSAFDEYLVKFDEIFDRPTSVDASERIGKVGSGIDVGLG